MDTNYNSIIQSKRLGILHRVAIAAALQRKDSITSISKELGFSRQTIHREIIRGTVLKRNYDLTETKVYDIYAAQYKYEASSKNKGRLSKIDNDKNLFDFVKTSLEKKLSPEVIANKVLNNSSLIEKVSAKTIYNWVYNGDLGLSDDILPYGKRKRRKPHPKEKKMTKPIGGESIDLRPNIEDRVEFGHWEIDCVVGTRDGKSTSLLTIVERKTRYGIIVKIAKKTKQEVVKALKKIKTMFGKYFYDIFLSITADNGSEFKDAEGMSMKLKNGKKVNIYFAHAYSSWERGTNENYNRMIRRWFKKGTDFCGVSQKKIDEICDWINTYPRKQFNFESSLTLFSKEQSIILNN